MLDLAILESWAEFAVRWLHVITGIAWIGSSFYFIALDLGLRRAPGMPDKASGEEWQVHGGGFYHITKYMVAPERLPEHLTWFKWESYATWMSGFALLVIVYWLGAELFLIDPNVMALSTWQAVLISGGSLVVGWVIYDLLCKSRFGDDNTRLMLFLFLVLVAMSWGYTQVFSGRAALLHLGAFTATIMSANVFMIIIPNQKIVVEDLKAGRAPDPRYGKIAKQRSTHNNYLTLPVVFLMLSSHYPLAFASPYNWLIAALVFLMGVSIRHYFNAMHARQGQPNWTWVITGVLFIAIAWLSSLGVPDERIEGAAQPVPPGLMKFAAAEGFDEAQSIVLGRCSMCHAAQPVWPGLHWPPKGVRLETPEDLLLNARGVYLHAGLTHAMPPGNLSYMEPSERATLIRWYRAGRAL